MIVDLGISWNPSDVELLQRQYRFTENIPEKRHHRDPFFLPKKFSKEEGTTELSLRREEGKRSLWNEGIDFTIIIGCL